MWPISAPPAAASRDTLDEHVRRRGRPPLTCTSSGIGTNQKRYCSAPRWTPETIRAGTKTSNGVWVAPAGEVFALDSAGTAIKGRRRGHSSKRELHSGMRSCFLLGPLALSSLVAACGNSTPSTSPPTDRVDASLADAGEVRACEEGRPFGASASGALPATIAIRAGAPLGPLPYLQGFLNGINPAPGNTERFADDAVMALKPAFWRFGSGAGTVYPKIRGFGARLTLVLSDVYADSKGGYSNARPFDNWLEYEKTIRDAVTNAVAAGVDIAYWDVWGEPQGGTRWLGSYDQLLELYQRTAKIVLSVLPAAKLVGPSFDNFAGTLQGKSAGDLIVDLDARYKLRLAAISWHELGAQPPEELPAHTAAMRSFLAGHLADYAPEIHVNEFSGPADHLQPGSTVGWLHYLTAAGVDVATRACWDVPDRPPWSDCWAGLDGLLRPDNKTPTSTYWVHRHYADLKGTRTLPTIPSDARIVALAGVDAARAMHVLLGRLEAPSAPAVRPVVLSIEGLGAGTRWTVTSSLVPAQPVPAALPAPTVFPECHASAASRTLTLRLAEVPNGASMLLRLTPE